MFPWQAEPLGFPCTESFTQAVSTPGSFSKKVPTLAASVAVFSLMTVVGGLLPAGLCLKQISGLPTPPLPLLGIYQW